MPKVSEVRSINDLAMDWAILSIIKIHDHKMIHDTFVIYEELARRIGLENTENKIKEAQNILKMVGIK